MKNVKVDETKIKELIEKKYTKTFSERYYLELKRKLILEYAEKFNKSNKKK